MERVTQLNSSEFSQFFEDTRNHKLNENQKNILLKLKEAVDMKEENLLTAEPNVLFQETELYQKALEMLMTPTLRSRSRGIAISEPTTTRWLTL